MHRGPRPILITLSLIATLFGGAASAQICPTLTALDLEATKANPQLALPPLTPEQQVLAGRVAAHPEFPAFLGDALLYAEEEMVRADASSERLAVLRDLEAKLRAGQPVTEQTWQVLGLTAQQAQTQQVRVQHLFQAIPELAALSANVRAAVLLQAVQQRPELRDFVAGATASSVPSPPPPNDDGFEECLELCALQFAAAAGSALVTYIAALAACTATGPAWAVCVALATTSYAIAIASADGALKNCQTKCGLQPCHDDADCASSEFCWTGVLGIGDNECRDKKEEGQTCSRHGQCESGCCKLHVWTNPFSKTCRPADKCD
jgi:hypothetical protein